MSFLGFLRGDNGSAAKPRRKYEHRPWFVPAWKRLPESVGEEYKAGESLLELCARHRCSPDQMRQRIVSLGVEIRPKGFRGGRLQSFTKLTPEQVEWILAQDRQDVLHADIGRAVGVSRERIRQICLAAGQPSRASRRAELISARTQALEARRTETAKALEQVTQTLSEQWNKGASLNEMGALLGWSRQSVCTEVSKLREKHPELFPHRKLNHWRVKFANDEERANHVQRLSEAWKEGASFEDIAKRLGYKNVASAQAAIYRARYFRPDQFPPRPSGPRPQGGKGIRDIETATRVSEAWKAGRHYYDIARELGYVNPKSLYNAITAWRKLDPALFPKRSRHVFQKEAA